MTSMTRIVKYPTMNTPSVRGVLRAVFVGPVMHPEHGHETHDEVDHEDDDETARRGPERRGDRNGRNRVGHRSDVDRGNTDHEREDSEDDVEDQVDIVCPDATDSLGLHDNGRPVRDWWASRDRRGHATSAVGASIKVSMEFRNDLRICTIMTHRRG